MTPGDRHPSGVGTAGVAGQRPHRGPAAVDLADQPAGPPGSKPRDLLPLLDFATVRELRHRVADRLAARLQSAPVRDPAAQRELGRALATQAVAEWADQQARAGDPPVSPELELALVEAVFAALFGLGRLQGLVDDERVENIEINGCDQVWVSYADGREEQGLPVADSDEELVESLQFLAARVGQAERTFTTAHPRLHLRLYDGSRLAAMAWTTPRPQVVIRRHRVRDVDVDDLVPLGTLDTCLAAFLRAAIRAGKNVVVTGLQNAGKTTLIRALANEFHPMERFATIEKEYELHLHDLPHRHPRVVAMEAREGSAERMVNGRPAGEVTLSDLVIDALRMNLRRLLVGEVRGDEALAVLEALSTGDGSLATIHARSARQGLERLVTLCLRAEPGMTDTFTYRLVTGAVDLVVNIRLVDESHIGGRKHRFVDEVLALEGTNDYGRPALTTVFGPGPDGRAVPQHHPADLPDLVRVGFDPGFLDHPAGTWAAPLDTLLDTGRHSPGTAR